MYLRRVQNIQRGFIEDLLVHPGAKSFRKAVSDWAVKHNDSTIWPENVSEKNRQWAAIERQIKREEDTFVAALARQKRIALKALGESESVASEGDEVIIEQHTADVEINVPLRPWPPGATIRTTPQHPCAPSVVLPH